jgi:hypothetical protein
MKEVNKKRLPVTRVLWRFLNRSGPVFTMNGSFEMSAFLPSSVQNLL